MGMAEIGIRVFLEDAASAGLYAIEGAMSGMLGVALGAAGGLLLFGGALAYSVKAAGDFQTAMFGVAVATHVPMATAMQYAATLMNLAATSTYSSDQIAQGVALLGRSGYSIGQIFDVARGQTESLAQAAIALGIATRSTAVESFGLMAQVMSAYSLKASEAAHVSDLLQFGFEHQRGSISEFAQGLSQVTGLAGQLHVPLREVVAALDVMGPAMRSSSTAGTALRYMLAGLYQPTKSAQDEMIALGLGSIDAGGKFHSAFYDAQGRALDFAQAVHVLNDHLKGLTDEQRLAALKALFSVRGGQGANSLLENLSKLDAYLKQLQLSSDNAGGAMRRWNEVMNTLQGAWAGFTSSIRDMAIVIGSALLPALTNFLNFANRIISQVRTWVMANSSAAASFLGLSAAISAAVLIVLLFMTGIGEVIGIILLVIAGAALLSAGILALVRAIQLGMSAQNAMGATLRALGAAFSALGTWIQGTLIPALQALWAWLVPRVGAAFSNLGHIINDIVAPAIVNLASWLQGHLGPAFSALGSFVQGAITAFQALWKWLQQNVIPVLQAVWHWAGTILGPALSTLGNTVRTMLLPALQQLWSTIQTMVIPALQQLWSWIQANVLPALQRFGSWIANNTPLLKALALLIAGPLVAAFTLLVLVLGIVILVLALVVVAIAGVITLFTFLIQVVGNTASAIGTFIHNTIATITSWGTIIGTMIGGVINWFKKLPGEVGAIVQNFKDIVIQKFEELLRALVGGSIVPDMINRIIAVFRNGLATVLGIIGAWVGQVIARFQQFGSQAVSTMQNAWNTIRSVISSALATIVSVVVSGFARIVSSIVTAGASIVSNISSAFSRAVAAASSGVSNIVAQVATLPGRIGGILGALAGQMFAWGANAMASFASGLGSMLGAVISKVQAAAGAVAGFLAHHSPPKEGPLKDDDQWMPNMMKMLAQGVESGAPHLKLAFGSALTGMSSVTSPVGFSGSGTTTINLMLDGKVLGQVVMNRLTGQLQSNGLGRAFK